MDRIYVQINDAERNEIVASEYAPETTGPAAA
jgi:hypothetical protein